MSLSCPHRTAFAVKQLRVLYPHLVRRETLHHHAWLQGYRHANTACRHAWRSGKWPSVTRPLPARAEAVHADCDATSCCDTRRLLSFTLGAFALERSVPWYAGSARVPDCLLHPLILPLSCVEMKGPADWEPRTRLPIACSAIGRGDDAMPGRVILCLHRAFRGYICGRPPRRLLRRS